jgi:hypothetical protein
MFVGIQTKPLVYVFDNTFINFNWNLQTRITIFKDLSPPYGCEVIFDVISEEIRKCGIED